MKKLLLLLTAISALALSGCAHRGYYDGYYGYSPPGYYELGYYSNPAYYDFYGDDSYDPFYDGFYGDGFYGLYGGGFYGRGWGPGFVGAYGWGYPYGYYGYGYPYAYGGYDDGGCYLVRRRIHTPRGWRIRRIEVCE